MLWLGPVQAGEIRERFLQNFGARVVQDGEVFWGLDSELKREDFMRHLSKSRGVWPQRNGKVQLQAVLPQGPKRFLQDYVQLWNRKRQAGELEGAHMVDLSQNPAKRQRSSRWLPTVARSNRFAIVASGGKLVDAFVLTASELNFSQGWPSIHLGGEVDYTQDVSFDLSSLSPSQQVSLTGTGVHLAAFGAWMLFIMVHSVRRDQHEGLTRSIGSCSCAAEDEVVEEEPLFEF